MNRILHVVVAVPDFYARSLMAMLFARDWRTRLLDEAETLAQLLALLPATPERIDTLLLDARLVADRRQAQTLLAALDAAAPRARLLWICDEVRPEILSWLPLERTAGCLLKNEIRHALAWAVAFGMDGWALTPGLSSTALAAGVKPRPEVVVLDGRRPIASLNEHETEVARLALIFSMERRELSDELGISEDWGYGLVSALYKKLGLVEVVSGEVDPALYLGSHPAIDRHLREIIARLGRSRKARDMEALAFHLLTMPDVYDLS